MDPLNYIAHFTNVSMRFTTNGGLFWAAYYGACIYLKKILIEICRKLFLVVPEAHSFTH
jgi:hypothetical protein